MKKYPKQILIVEGFDYSYCDLIVHENAFRGMLLSAILDFGVPIIFTESEKDTARMLLVLARRLEKKKAEISLRYKKSEMSLEEQKQFILEGFPGIGPVSAKALLDKFKTLSKVFEKNKKDLMKTEILDEKTTNEFRKILEK
jgi:Fanconi anemia group M protein